MPRKNPDGFKELIVYQRAVELYDMTFDITALFPTNERRRREQMESCARSVKQNIVEGWKRETTRQYMYRKLVICSHPSLILPSGRGGKRFVSPPLGGGVRGGGCAERLCPLLF